MSVQAKVGKVINSAKRHFTVLLATTFVFGIVAFNLFYGFNKYDSLYRRLKESQAGIVEKEQQIDSLRSRTEELKGELDTIEKRITLVQTNLYVELDELKSDIQELVIVIEEFSLSEALQIDEHLATPGDSDKREKSYVDFLNNASGQYNGLLRLDGERKQRLSIDEKLTTKYVKHFDYINSKRKNFRDWVTENGGFNLTNIEIAFLHHQALFARLRDLKRRVKAEEERIATQIAGNTQLIELDEKRREKNDELSHLRKENDELAHQLEELQDRRLELEESKKEAKSEIFQSYQVSGIPVSSSILLPLTHIGLLALYLWFTLHLQKILGLLSSERDAKEAIVELEAEWFFLYRDTPTAVVTGILCFLPFLYSVGLALTSLLYLQPLIEVLDIEFDYVLVSAVHYIIAGISCLLLLTLGVLTTLIKLRLINISKRQ